MIWFSSQILKFRNTWFQFQTGTNVAELLHCSFFISEFSIVCCVSFQSLWELPVGSCSLCLVTRVQRKMEDAERQQQGLKSSSRITFIHSSPFSCKDTCILAKVQAGIQMPTVLEASCSETSQGWGCFVCLFLVCSRDLENFSSMISQYITSISHF